MNFDDVIEGRIPEDIARDPARLSALWGQIKASDRSIENDPAAEEEWLAKVQSNAVRIGKEYTPISPEILTQEKQAQVALTKISKGEFNGMSDADYKLYRQRLLDIEEQVQKDQMAKNIASGMPVSSQPKGRVLDDLDNFLSQESE